MILCLDLGTKTGWATDHATGTAEFRNGRYEGGGMRFLRFRRWLDEVAAVEKPTAVYFEEVRRHLGTDAAHVYGGMLAVLTAWCEEHGVPYLGVPVGTIKKHATGKGNASKAMMMEAYRRKWGEEPQDDNECDARWIYDWAKEGNEKAAPDLPEAAADTP